jgi:hypothetical protein
MTPASDPCEEMALVEPLEIARFDMLDGSFINFPLG